MKTVAARAGFVLAAPLRLWAWVLLWVSLLLWACAPAARPRAGPPPVGVPPVEPSARAFLDTLQARTFEWFWDLSDSEMGLTPDRWPTESFSSVAAVGFALTAYPVGVERGWVGREEAEERVLATLRFFWQAPQDSTATGVTGYKGFFYHFLDMDTGHRFETVELSTIDTALLLGGVLAAREYFDETDDPGEIAIRAYADSIYLRVDWPWAQVRRPLVSMGWRPENGFIDYDWRGYNEAMLLYILALGSPTHPIEPAAWAEWTATYRWGEFYGYECLGFAPLFGHQYSHVWVDFRGIQDPYMRSKGIDYFENARRATYAQRAYAIDNPGDWVGYGAEIWGLTASDGPADTTLFLAGRQRQFYSYAARGAGPYEVRDDGTIAPTAAGGAIVFAPEIAVPALVAMRRRYDHHLFNQYGFLDAFNPTFTASGVQLKHGHVVPGVGWFDTDQLGIDQGPILIMIENQRSGLVWELMKESPYIVRGLCRAGFRGSWLEGRCEGE